MARKRKCSVLDGRSNDGFDTLGEDELLLSGNSSAGDDCNEFSFHGLSDSDDSMNGSLPPFNEALYKKYMNQRLKLNVLKQQLLSNIDKKKKKTDDRPQVGFSRFSVSGFSGVINSLSPERQDVIRKYGFGSLLLFDECSVPRNFVHWVARLVNYKSGDIVIDGKVISLTKEAVHLVLDLPYGGLPFPADFRAGKSSLLSRFGKDSLPPISFFYDALVSKKEMCDEDMFACFLMVALSTFLCPNSSVVPSQKYLGIFEDLDKIRSYDWCGFILSWLLEYIKMFNQLRSCKTTQQATLGGCLYFLAVLYLDHVDFGSHQVPSTIPRISVWKKDMIKQYANSDAKDEGSFGYHPIMQYSRTCYAKDMRLLPENLHQHVDPEFISQLDCYARCKLPAHLKDAICKLIEKHCLNCGISVNFDVNAINALSDEMRLAFIKLWKHVYSVSKVSQLLVLEVIKVLAESTEREEPCVNPDGDNEASPFFPDRAPVCSPAPVCLNRGPPLSAGNGKENVDVDNPDFLASQYNLHKSGVHDSNLHGLRGNDDPGCSHSKVFSTPRIPFADLSNANSTIKSCMKKQVPVGVNHSPLLDVAGFENQYVPDSVSPSPKPGFARYFPHKAGSVFNKAALDSPKTLDFTQYSPSAREDVRNSKSRSTGGSVPSSLKHMKEASPADKVAAPKILVQTVPEMSRKTFPVLHSNPDINGRISDCGHGSVRTDAYLPSYAHATQSFVLKSQETLGGRAPPHGPRRFVNRGPLYRSDFEISKTKFYNVSSSELDYYKILCKLAYSEFQNEYAVSLSGVRCTYWALGESLKPGGFVKTFVISCFCYSLFSKPNGHPKFSKRHYFFSNIGEQLLLDFHKADRDLLKRSFQRAAKARPLYECETIFFPIFHKNHWFVFLVDMKDHAFVFLDSYFNENSDYHEDIKDRLMNSFQHHWDKYVNVDMEFNYFEPLYPKVPQLPINNLCDSGIYAMMFLELWTNRRDVLLREFTHEDIPAIRIKIANELFFHRNNSGMKQYLYDYKHED